MGCRVQSRLAFALIAVLALVAVEAHAQAGPTAEKTSDLSVFLNATLVSTDYQQTRQLGVAGGVDYTRFLLRYSLGASLEGRVSYTPVLSVVGQRVYSGGLRLETTHFRRFRPYGDFLAGTGKVSYDTPPTFTDNAVVYTYGGGVDIDFPGRFSAKLDAQESRWRLNPNEIRHPALFGVGLVYHIPLGRPLAR